MRGTHVLQIVIRARGRAINLTNSGRIGSLLRAGRLSAVQDAVALALENNLDIELQRYGPRIAETDLLRTQAGGVARGVPTGLARTYFSSGVVYRRRRRYRCGGSRRIGRRRWECRNKLNHRSIYRNAGTLTR